MKTVHRAELTMPLLKLFFMLYKVALTFESVDEILKCDYSNESYWAVLPCAAVYHAVQGGSDVWVSELNLYSRPCVSLTNNHRGQ